MARWISWKTNILNKAFYEPLHAGVAAFLRCVRFAGFFAEWTKNISKIWHIILKPTAHNERKL